MLAEATSLNFSYSSVADVIAVKEEAEQNNNTELATALQRFAEDLEQGGHGVFGNKEHILRPTRWGMEIVSLDDLATEEEENL
ncbi:MAG: hypothetical protein NC218_03300 [Acetobacter sp.]|nr:hypothetical protein [Acetobacter sp.]